MKTHLLTITLALISGYIGGISSQYLCSHPVTDHSTDNSHAPTENTTQENTVDNFQFELLKYKVELLEQQLSQISQDDLTSQLDSNESSTSQNNRPAGSLRSAVEPSQQNLIAAGVSSDVASNILRRISQQSFRRLELQNLISRYKGAESMPYRNELHELNQNKISLRSELGDATYDRYLYTSGQNNRVQVSAIMAGSPAENSGLAANDIILTYDNQKILNWSDIRRATLNGDIGSYTNVDVLRNGERMTLMIPRGTLGVELDPVQIDPDNL